MANYQVQIVEYASRLVDVEASSEEMAIRIVKKRYYEEDIILDYADFDEVEFEIYND